MTTTTQQARMSEAERAARQSGLGMRIYRFLKAIPTWVLWFIVILWSLPTFSLFVNSFRTRDAQRNSGWWTAFTGGTEGWTIDNYVDVLGAEATGGVWNGLLNSFAIAIPATVIPIARQVVHILGQMSHINQSLVAQDKPVLDQILQFACVAGELVAHENSHRSRRDPRNLLPALGVEALNKMLD
jgi:ABC-type Fe3+ transport system permease subunit